MKDHPVLPMPGRAVRDALRDDVIDQLRSKTLQQLVAERAAAMAAHEGEADPYLRRRKWALSRVHTDAELRAAMADLIARLGAGPSAVEPDALRGGSPEYTEASFWAAIGGINYVGSHGAGMASLAAEDIDWGDMIGTDTFGNEQDAQEFSDALDRAGIPNTGPVQGPDGEWRVHWVEAYSD
jgi:hypothetical protein